MPLKICEYKECGKEFFAYHSYNRFCCQEHGCLNRRKPRLEGDCEYCHKHFVTKYTVDKWNYKSGHQKLRYCCKEHQLLAQRKDKVEITCIVDGKKKMVFPSAIKNGGGKFCSRACYHKYYSGENHTNWTGGFTEANYQLRKAGNRPWRNSVLQRDHYACVECFTKYSPLEVDHIYPWALFPELRYDLSNGRTMCQKCHGETPTWGSRKLERKDFLEGGRLFDYVMDALYMIGVSDPLA